MKRLEVMALIWGAAIILCVAELTNYQFTPGDLASVPTHWPESSQFDLSETESTLVLFVHPQCPCSRATLSELHRLLDREPSPPLVEIAFIQPEGTNEDWVKSDLWDHAQIIPHAETVIDHQATEAARFGVRTSGHCLVYTPSRKLIYSGGLTSSRGHAGANNRTQIVHELLAEPTSEPQATEVFGCSLFKNSEDSLGCPHCRKVATAGK